MLYDAYEKRILKIARVLRFIRKHALILLLATGLVLATTVTLLVTKGLTGQTTCPESIPYGESISCEASSFLSSVSFEYHNGNGAWSTTPPRVPGQYTVRAVGKSITGKPRHGKESTFAILPRELDVQVTDSTVVYGELPGISPSLPYGDILQCDKVIYEDILQTTTNVTPDEASVRILSKDGLDVTNFYRLRMVSTPITITPRPLGVTVQTATQTYNGQKFSYDVYDITSGSTAANDTLQATFDKWLIDAGDILNQPTLCVINQDGKDVTHHYNITEQIGHLVVEKRPLIITTGSTLPITYDGAEHAYPAFSKSTDTPLVPGHRLEIVTAAAPIAAGKHENVMTFRVVDQNSVDRTANYSLLIQYGTIEILKRAATVNTHSDSWVYDGENHSCPSADVSNLLAAHTHSVHDATVIKEVGTVDNILTVKIWDGDTNVTDNYEFTYVWGKITVTGRPITVKITDTEYTYDGLAHEGGVPFVTEDSPYPLVAGHTLGGTVVGTQTDAGTGTATLPTPIVTDGKTDVSHNYIFTVLPGEIKVLPRPILIVISDAKKTYDGTPLSSTAFTVEPIEPLTFALVEGHTVTDVKTQGSQTDAGSSENQFLSCRITDGEHDVTANYTPQGQTGTLTVDPRPITVSSGSANKVYDGTPLVCHDPIVLTEGSLVLDHRLDMRATGSIIEVGFVPNTIEGTVKNGANQDVGGNYLILRDEGKLEILPPNAILVTTGSASAPYTGNPLTCDEINYRFVSGGLISGHTIKLKTTGSQTEIGQSFNTYDISIKNAKGDDVSWLYLIEHDLGLLIVYDPQEGEPEPPTPPTLDESGDLRGPNGGDGGSGGNPEEDTPVLRIKADHSGKVYLRLTSFGDFMGYKFAAAVPYTRLLDNAYSCSYLTGIALQNAGVTPAHMEIQNFTTQYFLPYYLGMGTADYDLQTSDVRFDGKGMGVYSLPYYVYDGTGTDLQGMLGSYTIAELYYRDFVHRNYTSIDDTTRAAMEKIIQEQGFDRSDPELISRVASYVQSAATYKMDYNQAINEAENMILAFLEYKEGVCRQYAALGTMLFRALGIPARYTIGYVGDTIAGEEVEITGEKAHAWVEIYIDGVGWIPVEVTGGDSETAKPVIEIAPVNQSKPYDGTPLYAQNEITVSPLLAKLLQQNYTFEVSVSGERTEIGSSESKITSFTLYDPSQTDVTNLFEIVYKEGKLEVLPPELGLIKVCLYQLQKYYDGTPLAYESEDFDILEMEDGVTLHLQLNISLTEAGYLTLNELNAESAQYAQYQVWRGGEDVTELYRILFVKPENAPDNYIPIRVDPRPLEIATQDAEKIYDGTPLVPTQAIITMGSLLSGHSFEPFKFSGTRTEVGESFGCITPNTVVIRDKNGNNVTKNYDIVLKKGKITILSPNP